MSAERTMWSTLRPVMAGLDPIRVENTVGIGVPDVNYVHGWIELKVMARWPVKGGQLLIPHFTPQQRVWLERRWRAGGLAWLLLRVMNDGVGGKWLLFDGWTAFRIVGKGTRGELLHDAAWSGERTELVSVLPWLLGEPATVGGRVMLQRLQCCTTRAEVGAALGWGEHRVYDAERDLVPDDAITLADHWNA